MSCPLCGYWYEHAQIFPIGKWLFLTILRLPTPLILHHQIIFKTILYWNIFQSPNFYWLLFLLIMKTNFIEVFTFIYVVESSNCLKQFYQKLPIKKVNVKPLLGDLYPLWESVVNILSLVKDNHWDVPCFSYHRPQVFPLVWFGFF